MSSPIPLMTAEFLDTPRALRRSYIKIKLPVFMRRSSRMLWNFCISDRLATILAGYRLLFRINLGSDVLPLCSDISPAAQNRILVTMESKSFEDIAQKNPHIATGGRYKPAHCKAPDRVALIVPYRQSKT